MTSGAALARIDEQSRAAGEQFTVISTATQEQSSTATVLSRNLQSIAQANGEQREVANELALPRGSWKGWRRSCGRRSTVFADTAGAALRPFARHARPTGTAQALNLWERACEWRQAPRRSTGLHRT